MAVNFVSAPQASQYIPGGMVRHAWSLSLVPKSKLVSGKSVRVIEPGGAAIESRVSYDSMYLTFWVTYSKLAVFLCVAHLGEIQNKHQPRQSARLRRRNSWHATGDARSCAECLDFGLCMLLPHRAPSVRGF